MWEGDHGELEVAGMRIPTTHAVCNQAGPQTPLIAQAQVWWYNADGALWCLLCGRGTDSFQQAASPLHRVIRDEGAACQMSRGELV